ncbi:MAG: hypothetical protein HYX59_02645 [Elusimicrobia bacterium]|nr:hypothetical protein [Elusimicrobiota bacterium]
MTPRSLRLLGRKITAAALAAALVLSGSGPIYAQEIRAISAQSKAPGYAGETGALALPKVLSPLSPTAFNASLTPSLPVLSAPSLTPSAPALGGHARTLPALANPSLVPAAPAAASPLAPAGRLAALRALVSGPAPVTPDRPSLGSAKTPAKGADAVLPAEATAGDAKEFADAAFRRLHGEAGASASGAAPAVAAAPGTRSWKQRLGLAAASVVAGGALALPHGGTHAAGALPPVDVASGANFSVIGQYLGQAGYWIGNALAFVFPIPEVFKAIKGGKVAVPAWRAGILVTASLALGLVNATVAGMPFWGIQNTFAAAAMLLAWPAAKWGKKAAGEAGALSGKKSAVATVVTSLLALALAAAMYYAAAAVIPAALAAAFGAAAVANVTFGIMAATGGAFFLLFLPDVISIVRGRAPNGFTPGFSLLFLLASLGFVVWTGHLAWIAEPGSPQAAQYGLYAALNAAYVLVSGASWWIGRRAAKPVVVPAPSDEVPPAAEPEQASPSRAPPSRFEGLAAAESRAHSSARARAGNVRLMRVGVDLKSSGPRWVFAFHAPAKKQILTYGPNGVEARKFGGDERPAMLHPEDLPAVDLEARLAALAEKEPGFKPVRAEIVALAKGGLKVYGYDSKNNSREMPLPLPVVESAQVPPSAEPPAAPEQPSTTAAPEPVVETPAPVVETPSQADADMVQEYGPVHDEFPGLPGSPSANPPAAQEQPSTTAAAEPALPRSWKRFPAEAREATSAAMLAAKAEAQARARALAPDARLVSVAINLVDPRSHWIFIFRSDKRNEELTVWTKRVAVRKLGFRPTKAPTLWDTRLESVGPLDRAYAALKKANPRFRPVRVEVDPAWTGAASYRFLDAFGRSAFVGADGKPVFDAPALPVSADAKPPKSFESLPEDARGADGKSLLALKAQAQARARAISPDARLVKVAINLDDPRSHWIFVFRSDKNRTELTVWTKKIETKRLRPGTRRIPTLNDARLAKVDPVAVAYAALKAAKPGLKPVRLELVPTWKGDASWSFKDSRGRGTAVAAVATPAAPAPKPEQPDERGPPAPTDPAPPETTQPAPAPPATPAPEIPKPEVPKPEEPSFPGPRVAPKHIYEDFLGFRTVKGVRHDPTLKPLMKIETIDQVIDQISRQFNIKRERVIELGVKYRLNEFSPLESWIGVYDRLQAANRDQFKRYDSKKYDGWKSFRELANKTYAPGWKGALQRALEFHKHFIGAAVRFPYHLFDMFIFGYFRQAISFEFRHSTEDFMALSDKDNFAEQWLESSMRKDAFDGAGMLAGLKAKAWYRAVNRWFIVPAAAPLTTFLARRLTLAIMSAVAMGLLGAFAPVLPLSFALTSIPVLGPAIVAVLNGLPVAVAAVPFIGDALAPVLGAAVAALAKDLILGPLLNTLILSTLLTFPAAARERIAKLRDDAPLASLPVKGLIVAVLGAAVSWEFWKANLKSFLGLVTVGAEIEGIMTYAGTIDSFIDPGVKAVTGRELHLFHNIGAAVERPEGDSPIPFGGAITWGNTLLYKLQALAGFNISDAVMRTTLMAKGAVLGESARDLPMAMLSAQGLIAAAGERTPEQAKGLPFDPDLWKQPMDQVMARIKELSGQAGHLDAEIAAVKDHRVRLLSELGDKQAQLERLQKLSRPVTPEEEAELARLKAALATKADEVEVREKLAERRDLLAPPSDADALARLEALQKEFSGLTPPPDRNGYWEDLAAQDASMKALSQRLADYAEGRGAAAPAGVASTLNPEVRDKIDKLVGEIEVLRAEAKGEVAQRDATSQLLASSNRVRNAALRERRDGKDMLRFHTDMAKLASVMDLALSLNEINAAQAAIKEMMDLLEAKRAKIAASRAQNQQNQSGADQNAGNTAQWRDEIDRDVAADNDMLKDLADSEAKAGMVSRTIGTFQTDMRAFIDGINAQDRGQSADAATEYQRRIDLLPRIKEWRINGGNPNDPDAFSLKKFNENLAEVNDNITKAQAGLSRLGTMPLEYAGVLVVEVPGPTVSVSNPTPEQTRQILADRKVYWQGKKADFGKSLDSVNRMLDGGNTRTVIDEFGDPHPESLPRWKAQSQTEISEARAALNTYLTRLDANAASINRVAGSNIPMLSGLGLVALQDAIKNYGDSLKAVQFPESDTLAGHTAMMDLVNSAKLTPHAAREIIRWSKADATITAIDDATQNVLPKARTGLQGVVTMLDGVLADVDADLAFVNTGTGGGQALIDRKTVLLRDRIIPALQGAKSMLTETLIPYQQKSIDQVSAANSDYFKLYDSKKTVITEAVKLNNRTIPWAFATFGAADGNQAEARQKIGEWRQKLQKNLDGYDDAEGHNKGIREYQVEMGQRKDPNFTGTEVVYGETQPFSLPKKIAQYTAERAQRAEQINTQDAQINEIIGKIETISKGKYQMSQYRLPVGVTADAGGVARVQAAVDAKAIQNLVDRLKAVADEQQSAGGIDLGGSGGDGTVPSGPQAPITVSESQQISLLALEAAKRLVPTSLNQPDSAPAAYAIARFLYSDTVVAAGVDGLNVKVPATERFLARISTVLGEAIADIPKDEAYASSNGTSETGEQVLARKVRVFSSIDGVLTEAMTFFRLKQTWNQDRYGSVDSVQGYYDSMRDIYSGGQTANDNEVTALNTMQEALRKTMTDLEDKRIKISSWLSQLNPKEKSALNNVSEDVSRIMDKTRAVLESNIDWHRLQDQLGRSREILQAQFSQIDDKQNELAALLNDPKNSVQDQLDPALVRRIEALRLGRGGWANDGTKTDPASLVIRKSEYGAFVDALLGLVTQGAQSSAMEVAAIKEDLLRNPQGLASLIPNSKVLEFGDTADGFYLVYQSKFAVPHGLDTSSWVTLGNIGKVFGSNVSVSGYQLASPPSKDGENAPYGDKGVEVQVETLQGKNWVNYLNVNLHRFAFDIPADNSVKTGAGESRMMIFDDFAVMLFGDKLYVGLAGFADGAVTDTKDKPYYYGGNLKSSLKLTEVMKLNFEQRALFAQDPRKFLQEVNLDFTGYDPDLNRDFTITAEGAKKNYFRTQVGPQFDLNRLMNPDGGGDTFTLDLYWAKTSGTDDINQQLGGVSILKGFSLKNDDGKTWMRIDNRLTGEMGAKQNEIGDRLSVSFPDQGLVVSAEGKIIGGAKTYFGEISKKLSGQSNIAVSYGSQYVGMNNRLTISMNTSFTLAELWQKVSDNSAQNLRGGETLKAYNRELGDFFAGDEAKSSRTAMELQKVFEQDVARKLVTQDIGNLTREIQELRKAGAFMDNSRVRGMVGFVSNSVSNDLAERAVGGGFTVGTYTEMSLSKTQKQLIESKAQILYREGLRLQDRMLSLTKDWQAAVVEVAEAQWALKVADFAVKNAPSETSRGEAAVRLADAESRLHQAVLRYNALTGRDPQSAPPFQDLNSEDLRRMLGNIRRLIASPDRLGTILGSLNEESLKQSVGENPFNLIDWIPWVDRLSAGFGVQFQDMMANQALTIGASVRLPIYDPGSKSADKAYALESEAVQAEMRQAYAERTRDGQGALEQARVWDARARAVEPGVPGAAQALSDAIRAYRNGLIPPEKLSAAFSNWDWYMSSTLEAMSRAELLRAQAGVTAPFERPTRNAGTPLRLSSIDDAFAAASANSNNLFEIAKRQEAAEEMARAADHRVQKAWLDINVGMGLTAQGVGWLPSIGITGIPVTPVLGFELKPEEMRELQVKEHTQQAEYYNALKTRVESGLAVQFYQNMVALRSAQSRLAVYDGRLLPELAAAAASGGAEATRRYDQAKVAREAAALEFAQARETINFLLGRPADARVEAAIDERQALEALSRLLAAKDPVGTQRRILQARVSTAKVVEDLVDKNLKVELLQLEPVSLVVRSLGRLMGALTDAPIYNTELAAASRIQTLTEERQRDAYDGRRDAEAAKLSLRLNAARDALRAIRGEDAESLLEKSRLSSQIFTLQAGLLSLGVDPDKGVASGAGAVPKSWPELTRRLAESEQTLTTVAPEDRIDLLTPDNLKHRSAAFMRYYFAKQTLGREPIDRNFVEGWIELRLSDPGTPPEVLLRLAELRTAKADRLYRDALVGAAARADIVAAQFEGDARLLRFIDREIRDRDASVAPMQLDQVRKSLVVRLESQRQQMVARLGLPPATLLEDLLRLVPDDAANSDNLRDLAGRLIGDIRARQIDSIRRTLFDGGTPASWGNEDGIMGQIKANTIAERMSYKGFTPVATFGYFRGTPIGGGFIEAPDPREIEAGLEKVMGEVLRKEMQSSGRLQELTLRLHSLMVRVEDGAKGLEARRKLIESAERDLRARAEVSGTGSAEYKAAQDALIAAWDGFARQMTATKADFITLVTELEALGEGSAGSLRPLTSPDVPERRVTNDPKDQLLDYWAGRYADPSFESGVEDLFARMGTAVPAAVRARILKDAALYRTALADAKALDSNGYTPAEKFDRLVKVDVEGKRLNLRADLQTALRGVGLLDKDSNPVGAEFLAFMKADLKAASAAFSLDRDAKVRIDRALSETYWNAHGPSDAEAAVFSRLDKLYAAAEDARHLLLTSYLADSGDDATRFVLKDAQLDAYLKAQGAFDAELARALAAKPSAAVIRTLDGLYGIKESLDRGVARAKHGRGMAALDALISLEESRLRAARWTRQTPARIDPIAEALSRLRETRERWTSGKVGAGFQALYAVTFVGADGARTWNVKEWLSAADVEASLVRAGQTPRGTPGEIVERLNPATGKMGYFIDVPRTGTGRFEVIGGADAADAARLAADTKYQDNLAVADLQKLMEAPGAHFVSLGGAGKKPEAWSFDAVFGPGGKHSEGRVFFFEAPVGGKPAKALHPLAALSRPPEEVVMKLYTGDKPLSRDRFPNLRSLETSEENAAFRTLVISPLGAEKLAENARRLESSERRRGWIEVKLNSFGFARDENGQVAQLYRTKDDFEAQWKAYDNAERDLTAAERDLATAKAEEAARTAEAEAAKSAADGQSRTYQNAQLRLRAALRQAMLAQGLDERSPSFKGELDRRVAEPKLSKIPAAKDGGLQAEIEKAHDAYADEIKAMDAAAKAFTDASSKLKLAHARTVNAETALADAKRTLTRGGTKDKPGTWTLHRSADLSLGLDADKKVVRVAAAAARGPKALDESVTAGDRTPVERTLTGSLLAAVVDADGRLVGDYASEQSVDDAFRKWNLISYRAGGDRIGADGDEAMTKVRFSHYEENGLPVLLGENYLIERLEGAQSALWKAKHWSYLPFNWGNILLEIPRGVAGIPAEFAGRNPSQHHYLGRAYMYKTEGGTTENHGFFRSVLGAVDVLNLLPDPADRFFDPSQFPDKVRIDSAVRPGEGLWDKKMTVEEGDVMAGRTPNRAGDKIADRDLKVHLGRQSLQRQATHAAEDLEAARVRTLSRFHGGVEQITLETRRGRDGWYQESKRVAADGPEAVSRRLADGAIASDPRSSGSTDEGRGGDVVTTATPGHLFVDAVEQRVRIRPGADAFGRQADALKGYGERVAERGRSTAAERAALAEDLAKAEAKVDGTLAERGQARAEIETLRQDWSRLSQRIGEQLALQRRIDALKVEIKDLQGRIAFWDRYLRLLQEARDNPSDPNNPDHPRPPYGPNPMFWAWMLALAFLGALASALWHWLRRSSPPASAA